MGFKKSLSDLMTKCAKHNPEGAHWMDGSGQQDTEQVQFFCYACGIDFNSAKWLRLHQYNKHNYVHPVRQLLSTPDCYDCGYRYDNKMRLINHMQVSEKCLPWAIEHVKPLSAELAKKCGARDLQLMNANENAGFCRSFSRTQVRPLSSKMVPLYLRPLLP